MKKTLKKGERPILLGSHERQILIFTINEYLDIKKKTHKNNKVMQRDFTYLNKIMGKLLRKKRCCHCGNWI